MSNEEDYYSRLSILDKTNHVFDILQFDAKQCQVMSIEELKITAPIIVVKIFEKIMGLNLDNHINESAFESNADVVLRTLQTKYGLNGHITPSLLVRGDLTVLTQVMDILYQLATKNHSFFASKNSQHVNTSFSKEDEQTKKRVFNISARFNTTFTSSISTTTSTHNSVHGMQQQSPLPAQSNQTIHVEEEWISSRDRDEENKRQQAILKQQQHLKHVQQLEIDRQQHEIEKERRRLHPKKCNSPRKPVMRNDIDNNRMDDNASETTESSSVWNGWKDTGQRQRRVSNSGPQSVSESVSAQSQPSIPKKREEVYCYDTYSGYRVNPRLHALLIRKNNPDLIPANNTTPRDSFAWKDQQRQRQQQHKSLNGVNNSNITSPIRTPKSPSGNVTKKSLDRTMYSGTAKNLRCYQDMEPLDLLVTIEHSFKNKNGRKFTQPKEKEICAHHMTVADHLFKFIINMTHNIVKPHARVRVVRLNAQTHRTKYDVENKEFANSLEIQIAFKNEEGKVFSNLLFSRHKTRQWPSITVVDKRVRAFYSRINLQLHAIEGGDEAENEELLEPYPSIEMDYITISKRQKSPEILNVFDARYLFCPENDEDDSSSGSLR